MELNLELAIPYEKVARKIAKKVVWPQIVDELGNDVDDYRQDFLFVAAQAVEHFRTKYGFAADAEHRYVCKALHNKARDCMRARNRLQYKKYSLDKMRESEHTYEMTEQLTSKITLNTISRAFVPGDWALLEHVVESKDMTQAHKSYVSDMSYRKFNRKIHELKNKAKKLANS